MICVPGYVKFSEKEIQILIINLNHIRGNFDQTLIWKIVEKFMPCEGLSHVCMYNIAVSNI